MRKEIHRMELREIQLKKTQEHLLHELKQVYAIGRPLACVLVTVPLQIRIALAQLAIDKFQRWTSSI